MFLECSQWGLCPEWPGSGPLASIPFNHLLTVHAENFYSSLPLAPAGAGYIPRPGTSTGWTHGGEEKGGVEKHIAAL